MTVDVAGAAAALLAAEDILILTHRRPDGDTTGCAGALCRALRQIGKTAYILDNPDITPRYAPLIVPYAPSEGFVPGFIVSTDIAEEKLFPDTAEAYKGKVDLVIDHHGSNTGFGAQDLVRPDAGACAEVLYDVIVALGAKLTTEIAMCIYIGVSTDTGCFKFSNTTAHTHAVAAACLTAGVDGGEINRALFETKSRPRFEMERIVFDTMEFYEDGAIALALLWRADIDRTGADMDDLDSIASLTRQVEGVQIGITLTENRAGTVKASVRTTKEMDAAALCKKCGGGGHIRAAGATFDCGMEQAKAAILRAAREQFHAVG
ncbi:MAG: DHH family phosphoesterase [Eubacteriales bacterium]|nr:DHH family phosphoesterase [Eubacteriales bacterium]